MLDQHYISYSPRRVAQYLTLGAIIEEISIAGAEEVKKFAQQWEMQGRKGVIYRFTLAKVTPEMKKRVRELKYGRDTLTHEELNHNRACMRRLIPAKEHERNNKTTGALPYRKVITAAFDALQRELHAIESVNRQLSSRMVTIR